MQKQKRERPAAENIKKDSSVFPYCQKFKKENGVSIMQLYMAPMEGLTGYVYRNAYQKYFHNIDKYFTPFLTNKKLSSKEQNDILPEHNAGMQVVPQILTNRADDFLAIAGEVAQYGYGAVNLNLGCPSGTVVSKNRGSGFLAYPDELERFLDAVFSACTMKISVKTRVGRFDTGDWEKLLAIFEQYPLEELIIHPRIQQDFYKNAPRLETFQTAVRQSRHSLCYNGDIFTKQDFKRLTADFPEVEKVMLGRGILKNPGLAGEIKQENFVLRKEVLQEFHNEILEKYQEIMSGDRNTLFKMKELWSYLGDSFTDSGKYIKKLRKADRIADYKAIAASLFQEQELLIYIDN